MVVLWPTDSISAVSIGIGGLFCALHLLDMCYLCYQTLVFIAHSYCQFFEFGNHEKQQDSVCAHDPALRRKINELNPKSNCQNSPDPLRYGLH